MRYNELSLQVTAIEHKQVTYHSPAVNLPVRIHPWKSARRSLGYTTFKLLTEETVYTVRYKSS